MPYHLGREKEKVLSELAIDTVSFTIGPTEEWWKSATDNALQTTSESPSKTDFWMHNSTVNWAALLKLRPPELPLNMGRGFF